MTERETETEEHTVTSNTETVEPLHDLWEWLDDDARQAIRDGANPTEEQLDAANDRRRQASGQVEAEHSNVTRLPVQHADFAAGLLTIRPGQTHWTEEQLMALLVHCGLEDVPQGEAFAFLHLCQRTGLDPYAREIHLIGRREKVGDNWRMKYTAQTGIDGFRHIAERTGEYLGKEGPWWCGPDGHWSDVWLGDGPPAAARVTVMRRGLAPLTATALYREFVPLRTIYEGSGQARRPKRDASGEPVQEAMGLWPKMPAHMLAKCAEALAIRQAFPRQAAGVYAQEEMDQADARAADEAEREAQAERARQRRELASGFAPAGPGDPAPLGQVAPGEVIQGEVVAEDLDRAALMAELEDQARLHATTVAALARRTVAALRKNLEDFTDAELAALVRERRASAARIATETVAAGTALPDDPEPANAAQGPQDAPEGVESGPAVPAETDEERAARVEAVEERAREVARQQKREQTRARTRADKGIADPAPEQPTLGGDA